MANEAVTGIFYSTANVIKETGATLRQLYYWESLGLVHPQYDKFGLRMYRRYSQNDIELIRKIVSYLKEGYNLQTAGKRALSDLGEPLPNDKGGMDA